MGIINNQVVSQSRDVRFDSGRHPLGKIGFVLLATEQTVADDMSTLIPTGIGVHYARLNNPDSITTASLAAVEPDLVKASASLLPDGSLDVVTYACTSGSLVLGEHRVQDLLEQGSPGARGSSIISAVIRALRALESKALVVVTPYLDEVNTAELHYLQQAGFEVLDFEGMNLEFDSEMVKVDPGYIRELALEVDRPEADAIFISCGALRSIDVIQEIEDLSGKPVVSSNQAMAWDAMRLAGIVRSIEGYGRLLADTTLSHPADTTN